MRKKTLIQLLGIICVFVFSSLITSAEDCKTNCDCAKNTSVGMTCSNNCGGYCNGLKTTEEFIDNVVTPLPDSSYRSAWQFQMTYPQVYFTTNLLGYKNVNSPYRYSISPEMGLYSYKIVNCDDLAYVAVNNIQDCNYTSAEMNTIKIYLAPGSQNEITFAQAQNSGYGAVAIMRFNGSPQGTYQIKDLMNQSNQSNTIDLASATGKDFVIQTDGSKSESVFTSSLTYDQPGGWLYIRIIPISTTISYVGYQASVDYNNYKSWYDSMTDQGKWDSVGDPVGSANYLNLDLPTGVDCDTKVCVGNSCWNGTKFIPGIKTENCAIGKVLADPTSATSPGQTYLAWTSSGASKVEAACLSGPVTINRGNWFLNHAECAASGLVTECTDKGFELKFEKDLEGIEVCTFYPTNKSDSLPGIPFSVEIPVNGATLNAKDNCRPNNPSCQNSTCMDASCFDGCNHIQGVLDCKARR